MMGRGGDEQWGEEEHNDTETAKNRDRKIKRGNRWHLLWLMGKDGERDWLEKAERRGVFHGLW